jgi:tetratricopeptide (TPR) repeat protein
MLIARLGDREHRAASRVGGRLRLEDLRLNAQEARAAALFDGARSPAELAAASPGDALVLLRMALLLGEVDLLAFGASTRGAKPPAAAPGAPPRGAPAAPAGPAQAARTAAAPGKPAPAAPARPPAAAKPGAVPAGPGAAPRPPGAQPPRPTAAAPRPAAPPARPAPTPATPAASASLGKAALEALVKKVAAADHFEVLGVDRKAGGAQIKIAYFQLAKTYHPDAVPADAPADVRKLCADVFAKVSEAWSVLGEDASRAEYLEALKSGGTQSVDVMNIFQAEKVFEEGTLLAKARRYDEAIKRFDEAIELNTDEAEFFIWRSWCEFLLTSDKKAKLGPSAAAIEAALKKNPRCTQGYLFLGQMAKVTGDLALAERHLKRGLAVAPEHPDLVRELKYLHK